MICRAYGKLPCCMLVRV